MKDLFAVLGAVVILFSTVPYIVDIVRRKTKPNIVSWCTWTLLVGIGAAALFAERQTHAALLVAADALGTLMVVLFGLKYGVAKLDKLDVLCQIAALAGLALWLIFDSPMIAIVATISIDLIATIHTLRHSWSQPDEETASTFAICIVAAVLTIISLKSYDLESLVYPVYLLFSACLLFVTIRHGQRTGGITVGA
jgi:hypothetical protein